jgi:hypothetical protein
MTTGAISDYLEDKLLDHSVGTAAFAMPAAVYLALYTSSPTDADTGTELTGKAGYARQALTFTSSAGGACSNDLEVTFGPAAEDWGLVTHVGIRDADVGGNLLWWMELTESKAVGDGDEFTVPVGDLDLSVE